MTIKKIFNSKNFVFLFEIVFLALAVFNIFAREAILVATGLMIFYFIFAELEDSIWLFVASIPFFAALPITTNFDRMANWRILLIILFLVLFFKNVCHPERKRRISREEQSDDPRSLDGNQDICCAGRFAPARFFSRLRFLQNDKIAILTTIFLFIACLSLFVADDIWAGIKKIIFLINIFLLFLIIRNFSEKNKDFVFKLMNAIKIAIIAIFTIGFAQLVFVFIVPLHIFWQFWANRVIPVFYGQALGNLLSYSNTWFSYYAYQAPTLRMFSVFPDSHSFAMFCMLSLPFFLTNIFLRFKKNNLKINLFLNYFFLIICLFAIIFSGSRGAWASAIGVLFIFIIFILLSYSPTLRSKENFFITEFTGSKKWKNFFQLCIGCLIIFFLLLPISSRILFLPQEIQQGANIAEISLLERAKSILDFSEVSVKSRLQIWQKTADSIMKNPFLGVGIGNYPVVLQEDISSAKKGSSAHNLYLDVASEMGIFALLVLLAIFWQIFKDAWEVFNDSSQNQSRFLKYWAGFFVLALVWVLGYSLFDVVLLNDKVLLFFIANLGILYAAKLSISFYQYSDL